MLTREDVILMLTNNRFKNRTDKATLKRTRNKLYFARGIYTIILDDTGGGIMLELFKNAIQIDSISRATTDCLNGLFSYLGLSSTQKQSIRSKLLHLDKYVKELGYCDERELLSGQKKFIANYSQFATVPI